MTTHTAKFVMFLFSDVQQQDLKHWQCQVVSLVILLGLKLAHKWIRIGNLIHLIKLMIKSHESARSHEQVAFIKL